LKWSENQNEFTNKYQEAIVKELALKLDAEREISWESKKLILNEIITNTHSLSLCDFEPRHLFAVFQGMERVFAQHGKQAESWSVSKL